MCHLLLKWTVNITSFLLLCLFILFRVDLEFSCGNFLFPLLPLQLDLLFNFLKCRDMIMRHSSFMQIVCMSLFEKFVGVNKGNASDTNLFC